MKKRLLTLATTLALALSLASCGSNNESSNSNIEKNTITDIKGSIEIPADPETMVDLSGSSDMLEILGYDIKGTANSDAYDYTKFPSYLEETLEGATILGYSMIDEMDVEAIIALEPDLIVISTVQEKMYDQLSEIAPVVMLQLEGTDWKNDFLYVAETFQKESEANAWLDEYSKKATEVGNEIKAIYGEDVSYLSFLVYGESLFLFSNAGIGSVMYNDLGLERPANLPGQDAIELPVVTIEGLAEIDADFYIALTDDNGASLDANPIWNNLEPIKNGNFVYLPSSPFFNQGYSPIGSKLFLDEIQQILEGTYE